MIPPLAEYQPDQPDQATLDQVMRRIDALERQYARREEALIAGYTARLAQRNNAMTMIDAIAADIGKYLGWEERLLLLDRLSRLRGTIFAACPDPGVL